MSGVWLWAVSYALCPMTSTDTHDRLSSLTCRGGRHPPQALPYQPSQNTTSARFHGNGFPVLLCQPGVLGPAAAGPCQRLCVGQWLEPLTSPFSQPNAEPARGVSSPSLAAGQLSCATRDFQKMALSKSAPHPFQTLAPDSTILSIQP